MTRIDFHCHTKYSKCSNLEPYLIPKICKKRGLNGVMICDHDTVRGVNKVRQAILHNKNFVLIPGIEILTNKGEIIGVWIEEEPKTYEFPEVTEEIHENGGLVIIPHPYDKLRPKAFRLEESDVKYIDAIEVFNSRCIIPNANNRAKEFASRHSLIQTAGSDAHFSNEIGRAWISFTGVTEEEFKLELTKGNTITGGKSSSLMTYGFILSHRIKRAMKLYEVPDDSLI